MNIGNLVLNIGDLEKRKNRDRETYRLRGHGDLVNRRKEKMRREIDKTGRVARGNRGGLVGGLGPFLPAKKL